VTRNDDDDDDDDDDNMKSCLYKSQEHGLWSVVACGYDVSRCRKVQFLVLTGEETSKRLLILRLLNVLSLLAERRSQGVIYSS
jgi:hypothetical protein